MSTSPNTSGMREPWQHEAHAECFDVWAELPARYLRQMYEMFNEIGLLLEYKDEIDGNDFSEIGCATGELYRYLRHYHPEYCYTGYDISASAINRAKIKYPGGSFRRVDPGLVDVESKPSVVFSRDVVIHQVDPFGFLQSIVTLASEASFLRIRTRDQGCTELDPALSCQFIYGEWVPYMVLNVDELIGAIRDVLPRSGIVIIKNYMTLGGQVNRFLPKECYYENTGTAETAICVMNKENSRFYGKVEIRHRVESSPAFKSSVWYRAPGFLRRRILGVR